MFAQMHTEMATFWLSAVLFGGLVVYYGCRSGILRYEKNVDWIMCGVFGVSAFAFGGNLLWIDALTSPDVHVLTRMLVLGVMIVAFFHLCAHDTARMLCRPEVEEAYD